jgi:hypothetical protein
LYLKLQLSRNESLCVLYSIGPRKIKFYLKEI